MAIRGRTYNVYEVAEYLGISHMTVRRIFRDREGVIKLGPQGRRDKRDHVTLRIPEKVLERAIEEMSR